MDITEEIEPKTEALLKHESQHTWELMRFEESIRIIAGFRGLRCGYKYAKGFIAHRLYTQLPTYGLLPKGQRSKSDSKTLEKHDGRIAIFHTVNQVPDHLLLYLRILNRMCLSWIALQILEQILCGHFHLFTSGHTAGSLYAQELAYLGKGKGICERYVLKLVDRKP